MMMKTVYIFIYLYLGRPRRRTRNPDSQYSRYGGSESYSRRTTTTTTTTPSPTPEGQRRRRRLRRVAPLSESSFPGKESAIVDKSHLETPAVFQVSSFDEEPELEGLGTLPLSLATTASSPSSMVIEQLASSTTTTTSILTILEREEIAPSTTSTITMPPVTTLNTVEEELHEVTQPATVTSTTTTAPTTEEEALSSTSASILAQVIEEVVLSSSSTTSTSTRMPLSSTEPEASLPEVEVVRPVPENWELGAFDDEPEIEWFWDYLSERTESSSSPTMTTTTTTVTPLEDTPNITLATTLAPSEIEPNTDDMLDSFAVIGGEEEEEEDSSRTPIGEESRRRRRRERNSIRALSSSSPRRRRRRVSGTTVPTSPASTRLIGTTDVEESQDVFPSHVNLAANAPAYVRESDDFLLLSRWSAQLPQSGRSFYEQALRRTIQPDAIAGGTVGVCFGNGDVDIGPIGQESGGAPRQWDADIERLEGERNSTTNWSTRRMSDALPSRFHRCFATYREREERWVSAPCRSPRCLWRSRSLPRTSLSECVACLAHEILSREETRITATHYEECLQRNETERWRRMQPSTRTLVFRQHSCVFGQAPESRWHGLLSTTQRDIWGGVHGWSISIRVYILAMIPAGHPEMYRRGTMRIDILFRIPQPFHVLLGREIRMRGQLNWEGSRASRGQAMSLMWVPFPGDGEGLTGPVHLRRWVFESDFRYTDRPDVMVSALSLQLCDMEAWEDGVEQRRDEEQYPLPRAARDLRRRKNNKCDWWAAKRTGGYQIISDDENEEEAPSIERLSQKRHSSHETIRRSSISIIDSSIFLFCRYKLSSHQHTSLSSYP